MSCNCNKRTIDTLSKYSEDKPSKETYLTKLTSFLIQLLLGIIVAVLFILIAIPTIIYVFICTIFGIQANFKLIKLKKS